MSHPGNDKFEEDYIIESDATCIDPRIGADLLCYLDGDLDGQRLAQFESHLLDCLACDIDVGNATSLKRSLKTAS